MRNLLWIVSLALVVAVATPVDARPRKETPEKLYSQGLRQMKRGYYEEAILSFEKVRNHFPLNQYSVLAELRVADCLFEKADFISAVDAYQQFARLHPRHEEIDYAQMRVGRSYFKQSNAIPQKDQTYTELTLRALEGYEERFPDSDHIPTVEEMRYKCNGRLGRAEAQVGDFYYWRKSWHAAERRYQVVLLEYDEYPAIHSRARYRLGICAYKQGRLDDAAGYLQQVIELDPETPYARRAERRLKQIEHEKYKPFPAGPVPRQPKAEGKAGEGAGEPEAAPADGDPPDAP